LVDVTFGVDWVWKVPLSLLDQIVSAYSSKHGEYFSLGDLHDLLGFCLPSCDINVKGTPTARPSAPLRQTLDCDLPRSSASWEDESDSAQCALRCA
jgi:hypothetical protein